MTEALKPCPFCGGEVRIVLMGNEFDEYWWQVTRGYNPDTKCNCRVFMESDAKFTLEEGKKVEEHPYALELRKHLTEKWNTRAEQTCKNINQDYPSLFECSECNWECDDTYCCDSEFNYRPNCGRKIVTP